MTSSGFPFHHFSYSSQKFTLFSSSHLRSKPAAIKKKNYSGYCFEGKDFAHFKNSTSVYSLPEVRPQPKEIYHKMFLKG